MADNILVQAATGGGTVPLGTDSCTVNGVAGVQVSLGKLGFGGNDAFTYVTSSAGLPVAVVGGVTLAAGSAAIGSITNTAFALSGSLPAGTAVIGHVVVDAAPTTAVTGTFWQATQPVSAAALPLPAGAATAARQPALGTAGSASTDVLTVQGAAAMTALKVDGSAVTQPVSGTVAVSNTAFIANAGTNLNTSLLAVESGGHLAALDGKVPALGQALAAASVPVVLTAAQVASLTPPAAIAGFALDATLTGGTQKSKLVDSGGTNVAAVSAGGALKVDGSAATQPVSGTFWQSTQPVSLATLPALAAGSAVIGHVVVDTAPTTAVTGTFWQATQPVSGTVAVSNITACNTGAVTVSAALPAGTNTIGAVTAAAATTGGATPYHLVSAASTNATSLKASAGVVTAIFAFNTNAAARYLKLFDKASAPTLGTDTPAFVVPMPGAATGAGAVVPFPAGLQFSTGIAFAIVANLADSDATAVGAADCVVSISYK